MGDLAGASSLELSGASVAASNGWADGKGELAAVMLSLGGSGTASASALELCCGFGWG